VTDPKQVNFDAEAFLASAELGRRIVRLKAREAFFSQGNEADSTFYLQKGRAKLTVVSPAGKEATLSFFGAGDFLGEESIAGAMGPRLATATAITACIALKIDRVEMIRVLHEEHAILKFRSTRDLYENVGSDYVFSLAMERFSAALGFPNSADDIWFFCLGDLARAYGAIVQNWSISCIHDSLDSICQVRVTR
jgi:CRP-like cAMP-binding protein